MSKRTTKEDFLERALKVHGDMYDYSKVDYKTTETKVTIICKIHGEFIMRPRAHYSDRRGCPQCDNTGKSGFHESTWFHSTKFLYLLELYGNGERFLKFGVTINEVNQRVMKGEVPYHYKVLFSKKFKNSDATKYEKKLKSKYLKIPYKPLLPFRGDTECLEFGIKDHLLKDLLNL